MMDEESVFEQDVVNVPWLPAGVAFKDLVCGRPGASLAIKKKSANRTRDIIASLSCCCHGA
jgi:hypothetical protein